MGKSTGFLEYERKDAGAQVPLERIKHFNEFHGHLSLLEQQRQGARCMWCGVPFCQYGGVIAGMTSGCPLHNLVPETNDLVYTGNWEAAYRRLEKTHCFPEFTGRVCPALCEAACTCSLKGDAVATKANEHAVIEHAFAEGWVKARPPRVHTGKRVAVIGSGPAGLAAAMQLNRRGHEETVFERSDAVGGLLRYGIPNMKLEKWVIDRRAALLSAEGVIFKTGVDVGRDVKAADILKEFDRVILACGASNPRDISVPGRDAGNIYFAVDFLEAVTRALGAEAFPEAAACERERCGADLAVAQERKQCRSDPASPVFGAPADGSAEKLCASVKGRHVLVIGGGDTGNDCVGTAIRLGAKSVTQLEMMPKPPEQRAASNPWPEWPKVLKTDYGQEEAIAVFGQDPRLYQTTVTEFIKDDKGNVRQARLVSLAPKKDAKTGRTSMLPVAGTEKIIDAEIVLIAAGFLGAQKYVADAFKTALDGRTNVKTGGDGDYQTSAPRVFAAGDMRRGQSLVVWAVHEGRQAARAVDESLMGYTNL